MIKNIMICDRCGEQKNFAWNNRGFHLFRRKLILKNVKDNKYFDLCQDCYDSLAEWWANHASHDSHKS